MLRQLKTPLVLLALGLATAVFAAPETTALPRASGDSQPKSLELLKPLALALADGATALAADDFAGYQKALPSIRTAFASYVASESADTHAPLSRFDKNLSDRADLKAARRDFEPLSTAVADLVRSTSLHGGSEFHIFECPMSPVLGTGRWVQRTAALRNPFFGSAMLTCGSEIK